MSFFDGSGQRPHPEDPAALRARLRRDYRANVGFGQDVAVVRRMLWTLLRSPFGWAIRAIARDRRGSS